MINTDLRDIIGDLRFALATRLREQYPRTDGAQGFSHTAEPTVAAHICGAAVSGLNGDYYIVPGDGGGPIVVMVGKPDGDKTPTTELAAKDGQPMRLLQIGADRKVKLNHPRHTQFEQDMLKVLEPAS